ncbi:MAG: hypothetical protein KJ674_03835 [Nanoarchaeota archaeon]|nr:hypothetical protein [Nanoarchaeota archaeon]
MFKALEENHKILNKYLNLYITKKNKKKLSDPLYLMNINKCLGNFEGLFKINGWDFKVIKDFENFLNKALDKKTIDETTINRIKEFMGEIDQIIQGANV